MGRMRKDSCSASRKQARRPVSASALISRCLSLSHPKIGCVLSSPLFITEGNCRDCKRLNKYGGEIRRATGPFPQETGAV